VAEARRALVTDGQERWAVAACRSLARAGFRVSVAADSRPAVAHWSRFCRDRIDVPAPQFDLRGFVDRLEDELGRGEYSVVLAGGEASLEAISGERDRLERYLPHGLGLPPPEAVAASLDKVSLAAAAVEAGLDSPETVECTSVEQALSAALRFGYPVMVKPRTSVHERSGERVRSAARRADSEAATREIVDAFGGRCLVQRVAQGQVHSFAGVFADGKMIASSLARYLRTWPPAAGSAAFAETVPVPVELSDRVPALLRALGWEGIFEVELLLSEGKFRTVDFNPRIYGSVALAMRAGADLPAVWARRLIGEEQAHVQARAGVRYRWEDAEVRRVWWEFRRGRPVSAVRVAIPMRTVVHPHFAWDDPGPILALVAADAKRAITRLRPAALASRLP
jgi:predicted ATP-grasp superfamily ATP-dependent carboligase